MAAPLHRTHYRPDIDGLRAIAVVSVILHHALPEQFKGGFVGVDVFFIISGYLISSIILAGLRKERFSFVDFYAKRIKRIFPALTLVFVTTLVMGWYLLGPPDYKQLGKHVFAGSAFVSNLAFWREAGYFDANSVNKPLLHLWSLAIEEQFYLLWPLTLFLLHKWRSNIIRVVFVLILVSFAINMGLVKDHPTAAFYNPLARFWEMLIGALLAAMQTYRLGWGAVFRPGVWGKGPDELPERHPLRNNIYAWAGAAMLLLVLVRITPERTFPGWWALLPTVGTALLISCRAQGLVQPAHSGQQAFRVDRPDQLPAVPVALALALVLEHHQHRTTQCGHPAGLAGTERVAGLAHLCAGRDPHPVWPVQSARHHRGPQCGRGRHRHVGLHRLPEMTALTPGSPTSCAT